MKSIAQNNKIKYTKNNLFMGYKELCIVKYRFQ